MHCARCGECTGLGVTSRNDRTGLGFGDWGCRGILTHCVRAGCQSGDASLCVEYHQDRSAPHYTEQSCISTFYRRALMSQCIPRPFSSVVVVAAAVVRGTEMLIQHPARCQFCESFSYVMRTFTHCECLCYPSPPSSQCLILILIQQAHCVTCDEHTGLGAAIALCVRHPGFGEAILTQCALG